MQEVLTYLREEEIYFSYSQIVKGPDSTQFSATVGFLILPEIYTNKQIQDAQQFIECVPALANIVRHIWTFLAFHMSG